MRVTSDWRIRLCRLITKPFVSRRRRLRPRVTVLPLRARVMASHSLSDSTFACHLRLRSPRSRKRRLRLAAHQGHVLLAELAGLDRRAAQVAFALAGLVAQQVFLARVTALQLAGRRHTKAFLRTLMRLHLR